MICKYCLSEIGEFKEKCPYCGKELSKRDADPVLQNFLRKVRIIYPIIHFLLEPLIFLPTILYWERIIRNYKVVIIVSLSSLVLYFILSFYLQLLQERAAYVFIHKDLIRQLPLKKLKDEN